MGVPESVTRELEQLFFSAAHEVFEDGVESEFSCRFVELVRTSGDTALLETGALLHSLSTPVHVAAEALRWLGRIDDSVTHNHRRWILADSLRHRSILVRDAAVAGLAALDDPSVKPYVQRALVVESSAQLREDLSQLLEQLEHPERGYALARRGPPPISRKKVRMNSRARSALDGRGVHSPLKDVSARRSSSRLRPRHKRTFHPD